MGGSSTAVLPPAVRKTHRALLPLFVVLVCFNYLDRTSLAFAALQLCEEPWFNAGVYGLGSGVFYAGYVTSQIPSNLLLARFGARTWLPAITAAWSIVAMCTATMHSPGSFYVLRLMLGVTEAGCFPGMWYVCGQFYPDTYITLPYSIIEASIAMSQILAAPVAAALLQLGGLGGLAGWQWLFLMQGAATLLLAVVLRCYLPDSVATASFLNEDDKQWLQQRLYHTGSVQYGGASGGSGGGKGGGSGGDGCSAADRLLSGQQYSHLPAAAAAGNGGGGGGGDTEAPRSSRRGLMGNQTDGNDSKGSGARVVTLSNSPGRAPARVSSSSGLFEGAERDCGESWGGGDNCELPQGDASARSPAAAAASAGPSQGGAAAAAGAGYSSPGVLGAAAAVKAVLKCRWIWYLMALKALKDLSLDALVYWVPTLVHALIDGGSISLSANANSDSSHGKPLCGSASSQVTAILLTAIPFAIAAATALFLGRSSEKRQERHKHIGLPMLAGGIAFLLMPLLLLGGKLPAFAAVIVAVAAADATVGPFWTWVHLAAPAGAGAVSLAAVNSVGKAGGLLGPLSFGVMKHATGSYLPSILLVGAAMVVGACMALGYRGPEQSGVQPAKYSQLPCTQDMGDAEPGAYALPVTATAAGGVGSQGNQGVELYRLDGRGSIGPR